MNPKITITHKEAFLALLRSGEPYVTESETTESKITSLYYKMGSDEAIAKVVLEGANIGQFTSLSQRFMCGDETAQVEIERLQAEQQSAALATH